MVMWVSLFMGWQNCLQLLWDGCKFNEEFLKNQKRLIVIDAMKGGKVDKIRSTLF